jgi:autotransporter-associated beta strand protein
MVTRIGCAVAAVSCLFVASANAQTWDGGGAAGGPNIWTAPVNWNPDGVPANNGTANLIMAGVFDVLNAVDVNFDINSLTFNNTAGAFNIASPGPTLTIRGGGITNQDAQTQTINAPLVLGATQTWNAASGGLTIGSTVNLGSNQLFVDGAFNTTINGVVQNTIGGIVKNGVGTLDISGNNLHNGGLVHNNGVLIVSNNGAAGTGTLTINSGTIQAGASPKTLANAVTLGGNFSVSGAFDMNFSGAATLNGNRTITVSNGITTFSGAIGEDIAGRIFVKSGTGTMVFSGGSANTYTGDTFAIAGTLLLSKTAGVNAIGSTPVTVGDAVGGVDGDVLRLGANDQIANTGSVIVNIAGLFDLAGFSETINTLALNGGRATTGTGTLTLTNALNFQGSGTTSMLSGNLNLNGGVRSFNIDDGAQPTDVDVSAVISNGGVTKNGGGTILFSGGLPNTYTGTTTVSDGRLVLGKMGANGTILGNLTVGDGSGAGNVIISAPNQIADTANVTLNDANLDVSADEDGFGLLTFTSGSFVQVGATASLTLTNDVVVNPVTSALNAISGTDRPLILNGTRTFTVNDDAQFATVELSTSVAVQGGTLVKEGLGTMGLFGGTAANTMGLTVNAGRVVAAKSADFIAAMTGNVVVGDGVGGVDADILQINRMEQIDQTASDTLTINSSGLLNLNGNDETIGNLVLNGGRTTSGTLRFFGHVTSNANSQTATIGSAMFLDFGTTNFTVADGSAAVDLNITGAMTSGAIDKIGAGSMQLTNTADATVTINVNEGTLLLANPLNPAIEGTLAIGDGNSAQGTDVARLMADNQLSNFAAAISVQSSGLLDLNGFSDTVGALYMSAGIITTGAGTLSLDQFIETFAHPLTSSVAGNIGLGAAPRSFNVHDGAAAIDLDVTATITAGVGGQLIKEGAGTMQLSGTQNVAMLLNAGTLASAFTIGPTGSLTQNAGTTLTGTLTNQGTFTFNGGTFAGQLINEGATSLGDHFTVGNGVINFGVMNLALGQSLTTNGAGFDNQGTLTLASGTIDGNGPLLNNSLLSGRGTIAGSAGFANNGVVTIAGGNLSLTNFGTNTNAGLITVPFGMQLRLLGANLYNTGIIDLDGGSITGSATGLYNQAGGTIQGGSSIQSPMTNNGGLIHANAGSTLLITNFSGGNTNGGELRIEDSSGINVTTAFDSSGTIVLLGANAQLIGGAVTNTGTIRGSGRVSNAVLNSGTVLAESGRLTLSGSGHTNPAAGIVEAHAGAEVFYSQGLATNAGQIALVGGTFDNNSRTLANTGSVAGDGVIRTGGLTNTGSIGVGGGDLDLVGPVTNNSTVSIQSGSTARFFGSVNGPGNYTGTGTTMFLNSFSPGASPAQVNFGGDLILGGTATLMMELAGTTPGTEYDRLVVAGSASLAGALDVLLLDSFTPAVGNTFEIIAAAGGVSGTFTSETLPALAANLEWDVLYGSNNVTLQVLSTALLGDYNQNGTVDAADYVVWRNLEGQSGIGLAADGNGDNTVNAADYGVWRANFGIVSPAIGAGSGAGVGLLGAIGSASAFVALPEPTSLMLFALVAAAPIAALRRYRKLSASSNGRLRPQR